LIERKLRQEVSDTLCFNIIDKRQIGHIKSSHKNIKQRATYTLRLKTFTKSTILLFKNRYITLTLFYLLKLGTIVPERTNVFYFFCVKAQFVNEDKSQFLQDHIPIIQS